MAGPCWRERAHTITEAAAIAGLSRATLDVWRYRYGTDLPFGRAMGRWWLSPRDIAVLRTSICLKTAMPLCQAIPTAFQHLLHRPPPDVLLVVDQGRAFTADVNTAAQYAVERGATIVPIGALAAEVEGACAALYQRTPDQQKPKRISA